MGTRLLLSSVLFALCAVHFAAEFVGAETAAAAAVVVGSAVCSDCAKKKIEHERAFKGLHVAVKCKAATSLYETKALGELDDTGSFNIPLPADPHAADANNLNHDCFVELHSTASPATTPCPAKPSKLIPTTKVNGGERVFTAASGTLSFESATCASATYKFLPWHHKFYFPPKSHYFPPTFKKPLPPPIPVPTYKPPAPVYEPPAPVYKPPTPVYKPPTPVYKPPTPVYKPPTPVYTPPTPVYKPVPFYHKHPKPFPHFHKFPPYSPHPLKKYFKKKHHFFPPAKAEEKP